MRAAAVPMNLVSGVERLDYRASDWRLVGPPAVGENRVVRRKVRFESPFANPPILQLGLVGLDISNEDYARLSVRAESITADDFILVAETWFGSQVFRVEVSWLALGH